MGGLRLSVDGQLLHCRPGGGGGLGSAAQHLDALRGVSGSGGYTGEIGGYGGVLARSRRTGGGTGELEHPTHLLGRRWFHACLVERRQEAVEPSVQSVLPTSFDAVARARRASSALRLTSRGSGPSGGVMSNTTPGWRPLAASMMAGMSRWV
jgi:hypothetical protein